VLVTVVSLVDNDVCSVVSVAIDVGSVSTVVNDGLVHVVELVSSVTS
jgi:hypothetical protein